MIPRLLLVTDRRATAGRDLVTVVERALDAGLPAVQLREKDLPGRALSALAQELRLRTAERRALFFVNDRIDVALAAGADGVHLGERSFPVAAVRGLAPGLTVGVSRHDVAAVAASTADFVVFGPVFATPSKAGLGEPQGVARLAAACGATARPVVAIGGINAAHVPDLRAAGAHGVAVIRAILGAADPAGATRALLRALGTDQNAPPV